MAQALKSARFVYLIPLPYYDVAYISVSNEDVYDWVYRYDFIMILGGFYQLVVV